eukprot:scaffold7245_cov119-Isochrysis_galbana.AAC.1
MPCRSAVCHAQSIDAAPQPGGVPLCWSVAVALGVRLPVFASRPVPGRPLCPVSQRPLEPGDVPWQHASVLGELGQRLGVVLEGKDQPEVVVALRFKRARVRIQPGQT